MRRFAIAAAAAVAALVGAWNWSAAGEPPKISAPVSPEAAAKQGLEVATFAAGCFWCVEADFDKVAGVVSTMPGYTGGRTKSPTYWSVATEATGHVEAVQLTFDPKKISYKDLLQHYWHGVDPVDGSGQFCDRGSSYRPAIFTYGPEQQKAAEASKTAIEQSKRLSRPIKVEIVPASEFTPAEMEHRKYYQTHPYKYRVYRLGCGRDARLKALWGDEAASH